MVEINISTMKVSEDVSNHSLFVNNTHIMSSFNKNTAMSAVICVMIAFDAAKVSYALTDSAQVFVDSMSC